MADYYSGMPYDELKRRLGQLYPANPMGSLSPPPTPNPTTAAAPGLMADIIRRRQMVSQNSNPPPQPQVNQPPPQGMGPPEPPSGAVAGGSPGMGTPASTAPEANYAADPGVDPASVSAIVGLSANDAKRRQIALQYAQAKSMRESEMDPGIRAGRVYHAASPLSLIGTGLQAWRGYKLEKKTEQQDADLSQQEAATRKKFADIIFGQKTRRERMPSREASV